MTHRSIHEYLTEHGWREVSGADPDSWQAPITLTGKPHYFTAAAALELERSGGLYAYSAESLMAEIRHSEDIERAERSAQIEFQRTGQRRGVPPNY
jgi:hypothetical protein